MMQKNSNKVTPLQQNSNNIEESKRFHDQKMVSQVIDGMETMVENEKPIDERLSENVDDMSKQQDEPQHKQKTEFITLEENSQVEEKSEEIVKETKLEMKDPNEERENKENDLENEISLPSREENLLQSTTNEKDESEQKTSALLVENVENNSLQEPNDALTSIAKENFDKNDSRDTSASGEANQENTDLKQEIEEEIQSSAENMLAVNDDMVQDRMDAIAKDVNSIQKDESEQKSSSLLVENVENKALKESTDALTSITKENFDKNDSQITSESEEANQENTDLKQEIEEEIQSSFDNMLAVNDDMVQDRIDAIAKDLNSSMEYELAFENLQDTFEIKLADKKEEFEAKLKEVNDAHKNQLTALQFERQTLQETNDKLKNDLKAMTEKCNQLDSNMKNQQSAAELEGQRYKLLLKELEEAKLKLKAELNEKDVQLKKLRLENEKVTQDYTSLKTKVDRGIAKGKMKKQELQRQYEEKIQTLELEKDDLGSKKDDCSTATGATTERSVKSSPNVSKVGKMKKLNDITMSEFSKIQSKSLSEKSPRQRKASRRNSDKKKDKGQYSISITLKSPKNKNSSPTRA